MTTYQLTVRSAARCELDVTHQSYRKAHEALMAYIPVAQNVLHHFQIHQLKRVRGDVEVNEVAHGSFYGGQRI